MRADQAQSTQGNQGPHPCADRQKKLAQIMLNIEKAYGKGAAVRLRDQELQAVAIIPTGSLALDVALGVGGLPRGRIVEIQGGDSSGKTTLALHVIAEAQKLGGVGVFIDAEHALDVGHARSVGVAADSLIISRPNCAEEALSIASAFTRNGVVDVIVIDSVAGAECRDRRRCRRELCRLASEIDVPGSAHPRRGGEPHEHGHHIYQSDVLKNKVAPPSRFADIEIIYGEGISRPASILDAGQELLLIEKSGSSFTYGDTRLGSGREKAKQYLSEHPMLMDEIERDVRQKLATGVR